MHHCLICLFLLACLLCGCHSPVRNEREARADEPPPAPREFRAVWVATVANIDWPSEPGLPTEKQQQEAIAILDRARELNLNAIVLQVRPAADALYPSDYEPWSWYLTKQQGKAPEPFYDPLKFWIDEAHKRGLELHAWFNPYRARHGGARYETSANHVSKTNPRIVREFNNWQWLDPAEREAQDLTFNVFMDVVKRYDVDGIHIDDYFYPYPDYLTAQGVTRDFPDDEAWQRYQQSGGRLSRDDWRRDNVDRLIKRIYQGTKRTRKEVLFGISPFGIGRPDRRPPGIEGFSQFDKLYANAELWLNEGWLDYWTPQLYWRTTATSQPYAGLLNYWISQNHKNRHVWPGLYTSRVGERENSWEASEIVEQIEITRATEGADGHVHFSMKVLMQNRGGIGDALKAGPYGQPALVPASTWLDKKPPAAPRVSVSGSQVAWTPGSRERPWQYAVWTRGADGAWRFAVYPGETTQLPPPAAEGITAVCVSAVDRLGNESKRIVQRVPK